MCEGESLFDDRTKTCLSFYQMTGRRVFFAGKNDGAKTFFEKNNDGAESFFEEKNEGAKTFFENQNDGAGSFFGTEKILLPGGCSGKFCPLP